MSTGEEVRYYRVSPRFWARAEQRGWSDDDKILALYLLTGPHRTTEGLYRLPKKYAQADLEWSPERFDKRLAQLIADGFCDYDEDAQVVLVMGAMKYQSCANDNMAKAAVKRLMELPETRLTETFRQLAEQFDERLAERLPEGFGEPQALALARPPSPGESPTEVGSNGQSAESGADDADSPASTDVSPQGFTADDAFEKWWDAYPQRNGKKVGKGNARAEFAKLTWEQRRRAYWGAVNLAKSDTLPKDPERFLRKSSKSGEFPFDDWQQPDDPSVNGHGQRLTGLAEVF